MVFGFAASGAGLLAAMSLGIDRRPGAALGLLFRDATVLIAFGDMIGLAFLLIGVFRFVAAGHGSLHRLRGDARHGRVRSSSAVSLAKAGSRKNRLVPLPR